MRLNCFVAALSVGIGSAGFAATPINRFALVTRHNPVLRKADPVGPLSLGNGSFAFTADITGLQTFPEFHAKGIPLCILSSWGWQTFPNPSNYRLEQSMVEFDTYGRLVQYPTSIKSDAAQYCDLIPTASDSRASASRWSEATVRPDWRAGYRHRCSHDEDPAQPLSREWPQLPAPGAPDLSDRQREPAGGDRDDGRGLGRRA